MATYSRGDSLLALWDVGTREVLEHWALPGEARSEVTVSPDGRRVAVVVQVGYYNTRTYLYERGRPAFSRVLPGTLPRFQPDGSLLTFEQSRVTRSDGVTGDPLGTFPYLPGERVSGSVHAVGLSSDASRVTVLRESPPGVVGRRGEWAEVRSLTDGQVLHRIGGSDGIPVGTALSSDGSRALVAYQDSVAVVWDVRPAPSSARSARAGRSSQSTCRATVRHALARDGARGVGRAGCRSGGRPDARAGIRRTDGRPLGRGRSRPWPGATRHRRPRPLVRGRRRPRAEPGGGRSRTLAFAGRAAPLADVVWSTSPREVAWRLGPDRPDSTRASRVPRFGNVQNDRRLSTGRRGSSARWLQAHPTTRTARERPGMLPRIVAAVSSSEDRSLHRASGDENRRLDDDRTTPPPRGGASGDRRHRQSRAGFWRPLPRLRLLPDVRARWPRTRVWALPSAERAGPVAPVPSSRPSRARSKLRRRSRRRPSRLTAGGCSPSTKTGRGGCGGFRRRGVRRGETDLAATVVWSRQTGGMPRR